MTPKQKLFNRWNGVRHETEGGGFLTCELKMSWSIAKMQDAIENFQAKVNAELASRKSNQELLDAIAPYGWGFKEVGSLTIYSDLISAEEKIEKVAELMAFTLSPKQSQAAEAMGLGEVNSFRVYAEAAEAAHRIDKSAFVVIDGEEWWRIAPDGRPFRLDRKPKDRMNLVLHQEKLTWEGKLISIVARYHQNCGKKIVSFEHLEYSALFASVDSLLDRKAKYWSNPEVIYRSGYVQQPNVAIAYGETIALAGRIAQDLDSFLADPQGWLTGKTTPGKYDVVLGGNK